MSLGSRTRDERCWNWRRFAGGGGTGVGLPGAADEAADGGICVAENVSGVRVDYASGEVDLPGVRECADTGGGRGSRMSGF